MEMTPVLDALECLYDRDGTIGIFALELTHTLPGVMPLSLPILEQELGSAVEDPVADEMIITIGKDEE